MKRPAAATPAGSVTKKPAVQIAKKIVMTPLQKCCVCSKSLATSGRKCDAVVYGQTSAEDVHHVSKRCCNKECRTYHYYNYYWWGGRKYNSLPSVDGLHADVEYLFTSVYTGFTTQYLAYHDALQYRGFLSNKAISWSGAAVLHDTDKARYKASKLYTDAKHLYVALKEMNEVWTATKTPRAHHTALLNIEIDHPITDAYVREYSAWWHSTVVSKADSRKVIAVSCDGEQKVAVKCAAGEIAKRGAGRPRSDGSMPNRGHGWFMAADADTGMILGIAEMKNPESNKTYLDMMTKTIFPKYKNVKVGIYDRMCRVLPEIKRTVNLKKAFQKMTVKTTDKMHGFHHSDDCPCSPWNHDRLWNALDELNSAISEQVFSWFRNYTTTFNTMSPTHQRFYTLYYAKRHNIQVITGDVEHLNAYSGLGAVIRTQRAYECNQ